MTVEEREVLGSLTVRRVRAEEWRSLRELRLDALRDPIAHLAYLETVEAALERPDSFWEDRTRTASSGTAAGQFVAVDERGDLGGTVTALVTAPGEPDINHEMVRDLRGGQG